MIKSTLKVALNRLLGQRYPLDRATDYDTDLSEILSLIERLRPQGTTAELIRIGSFEDGGYLVPDDLDGLTAAVSPGVGLEISFDLGMASRGIPVYMADASVDGPPQSNPLFHFSKKFLDVFTDETHVRLSDFCATIPHEQRSDMILQMDIEDAEWRVLLDTPPDVFSRFRIMVIEFHGLPNMLSRGAFPLFKATFDKLLATHRVVHHHPNNCCGQVKFCGIEIPFITEMTFYRRDRAFSNSRQTSYPHPLDANNVPTLPTLVLPKIWR